MYAIIPGLLNQILLGIIYSSSRFNADAKGNPEFLSRSFTENTHALTHQIASLSPLLQVRCWVIVYFLCCIVCHPHQSCEMGTIIILILQWKHGGPESIIHRHTVQKWRAEIQTWGFLPQFHYIFFTVHFSHPLPLRTTFICRGVSLLQCHWSNYPLSSPSSPHFLPSAPFPFSSCPLSFFLPLPPSTSFLSFPILLFLIFLLFLLLSPPLLFLSLYFYFSFSAYPIHHFVFWDWLVFHTLLQSQACLCYIQYAHFIFFLNCFHVTCKMGAIHNLD